MTCRSPNVSLEILGYRSPWSRLPQQNKFALADIAHLSQNMTMFRSSSNQGGTRTLGKLAPSEVKSVVDAYKAIYGTGEEGRKEQYSSLVNHYYDLVTDFYEFGWGQSFHFAPRRRGESFKNSLVRHQHFIASQLALEPGMLVLDLGCGVGGPLLSIAHYSGANIVGINNNAYQIERAKLHTRDIRSTCRFIEADYMQIPEKDDHFDAVYAIEATPHAPDKAELYREVFRVLRPGACFASYEWCLTDGFNVANAEHQRIMNAIMIGDSLPDILSTREVDSALQSVGFELLDAYDRAYDSDEETPWYRALQGRDFTLSGIPRTPWGRALVNLILRAGEAVRVFPKGSRAVSTLLNRTADALVEGGKTSIFTPMYFILARKPSHHAD